MVDRWSVKWIRPAMMLGADFLAKRKIRADQVTLVGFFCGILAVCSISLKWYGFGLVWIVLNRICDGLDGSLARLTSATDRGAFLDIVLDFLFYGGVVFGFALADPGANSLAASLLLFAFLGTGASFLAFAIFAEKQGLEKIHYPNKGFYYLGGLTEGTETIGAFVLFCLFPEYFPELALGFAMLCLLTVVSRVVGGYRSLR